MQLHSPRMALVNHELERVEPILWSLALLAAQVQTPRFQRILVPTVRARTYLEEHGVDVDARRLVEDGPPVALDLVNRLSGEVFRVALVIDGCNLHAAE